MASVVDEVAGFRAACVATGVEPVLVLSDIACSVSVRVYASYGA